MNNPSAKQLADYQKRLDHLEKVVNVLVLQNATLQRELRRLKTALHSTNASLGGLDQAFRKK